jgi:hypothetical protein
MMTAAEIRDAMLKGVDQFRHVRTGRVFSMDPAQEELLRGPDAERVLLIGFPVNPSIRQRGRKWQWLSPKNLEPVALKEQGR